MHDPAERARRLAVAAVELAEVTPLRPSPLEREHLKASLGGPCDGSMAKIRAWARGRKLDPDAVSAWVLETGAVCDCEAARSIR